MNIRRWMMIVAACALIAGGVRADEADLKKTFEELLPGMAQEQAQQKWQEICWNAGAPGNEARRSQACKLMAEKLSPGTPAPTRIWLLKQLERIGRGECVEEVAAVVTDSDRLVRDAAIRALANNPDLRGRRKLRQALSAVEEPASRVALINAISFPRGGREYRDPGRGPQERSTGGCHRCRARGLGKIATPDGGR